MKCGKCGHDVMMAEKESMSPAGYEENDEAMAFDSEDDEVGMKMDLLEELKNAMGGTMDGALEVVVAKKKKPRPEAAV